MVYEATILLIRYATTTQPKLDRRGLASDKFKSFSEVACLGSGCGSVGRAVTCIPEDRGSTPVIGKIYCEHFLYTSLIPTLLKRRK